ncbi:MAG: XRE family transcriptional regulator [Bacteriovoracia bacterium]
MKQRRYKTIEDLGRDLDVSPERTTISKMKAKLKKRIINEAEQRGLSAAEIAVMSGFSRTTVSGVLNGSLLSISLERLIRLASSLDLTVELSIKNAA